MNKHTPGPWNRHNDIDGSEIVFSETPSAVTIGMIYTGGNEGQRGNGVFPNWETGKANALLISAAPELLAEAKILEPYFLEFGHPDGVEALKRFRALIKKAEGKA